MPFQKCIPCLLALIAAFALPDLVFAEGVLNVVQQRILSIFLLATFLWVTELIPAFATSLLIITLLVFTSSDNAPFFLRGELGEHALNYSEIFSSFASPIIILFLGGFFIALASAKYKLDLNLARVLLKPFGRRYETVMLGIMMITGFFSMFMSNTTTTLMMLTIMTPLLAEMDRDDPGVRAMVLAIPVAANLGGMGTPIGTPPNAIAFRYFTGEHAITFGSWMAFAVPLAIIMIAFSWQLLLRLYPTRSHEIKIKIDSTFERGLKPYIVYATVLLTVLLWVFSGFHGMNAYAVAILPVAVFSITGIVGKHDLKDISWDVLWLLAGGIAIGAALSTSGLALKLVSMMSFDSLPVVLIFLGMSVVCVLMATFLSNTATANLLMPIAATMSVSIAGIGDWGGLVAIASLVALSSSLGMGLPISTPPNALAHASGMVQTRDFIRTARIISPLGILLICSALSVMAWLGILT
ncbi:SLC13 family permease [Endozoicomonadaceae bacterium StTr2]